jgi:hypothetical protein
MAHVIVLRKSMIHKTMIRDINYTQTRVSLK